MLTIRKAQEADVPALVAIGHKFQEFNPMKIHGDISDVDLANNLRYLMTQQILLVSATEEGQVVGCAAGIISPAFWNFSIKLGVEQFWWLDPEHRVGGEGKRLRQALERLAKSRGAVAWNMIALTTSEPEKLDKMYKKAGFTPAEIVYTKTL